MYLHYQRLGGWHVPSTPMPGSGSFNGYTERGPICWRSSRDSRSHGISESILLLV